VARPILVVKNLDLLFKRITYAKKAGLDVFGLTTPHTKKDRERGDFEVGAKAVRSEFGLPFALLDAVQLQGGSETDLIRKVAKVLYNGNRFDAQKLQRLKAKAGSISDKDFVARVERAIL
jgi:hypothetical protein